ncbi:MAG: HNH endonuclease [Planctomycetota bacterium]
MNAPLANQRWSWGAIDELNDRVFLRVWEEEVRTEDGLLAVKIFADQRPDSDQRVRPGYTERARHLERINSGSRGYVVFCRAVDHVTKTQIADYRQETVSPIIGIKTIEQNGYVMALLGEPVGIDAMRQCDTGLSTLALDYSKAGGLDNRSTEAQAMVRARLGQGTFRSRLMDEWGGCCAVTGCQTPALLRASHIKPWRASTSEERLDSKNGLLLVAQLDALFDVGLITFCRSGRMEISMSLRRHDHWVFGGFDSLRRPPRGKRADYLEWHRQRVFRGG